MTNAARAAAPSSANAGVSHSPDRSSTLAPASQIEPLEGEITQLKVKPTVGFTLPWAGLSPAPGIKREMLRTTFRSQVGLLILRGCECFELGDRVGRPTRAPLVIPTTGATRTASPSCHPDEVSNANGRKDLG